MEKMIKILGREFKEFMELLSYNAYSQITIDELVTIKNVTEAMISSIRNRDKNAMEATLDKIRNLRTTYIQKRVLESCKNYLEEHDIKSITISVEPLGNDDFEVKIENENIVLKNIYKLYSLLDINKCSGLLDTAIKVIDIYEKEYI